MITRVFVFLLSSILVGCYPVGTSVSYDYNLSGGHARSKAIFLSFYDNKQAPFRFYLDKDLTSEKYILTVRWTNPRPYLLFDQKHSTLKFMINKEHIISLLPANAPRIASYLLDSSSREEEAEYLLTYRQIAQIAYAKTADVELTGRNIIVSGYLNKHSSLRAFKNFLYTI